MPLGELLGRPAEVTLSQPTDSPAREVTVGPGHRLQPGHLEPERLGQVEAVDGLQLLVEEREPGVELGDGLLEQVGGMVGLEVGDLGEGEGVLGVFLRVPREEDLEVGADRLAAGGP